MGSPQDRGLFCEQGFLVQGYLAYKKTHPLGPYCRPMPRVLGKSWGSGHFVMGKASLYISTHLHWTENVREAAVERIWHKYDNHGQILALAFEIVPSLLRERSCAMTSSA